MFDESRGMLGLSRQGLGDERVPALSLEELKDAYRGGRASLTSWTTAGVFNGGDFGVWRGRRLACGLTDRTTVRAA